MRFFKNLKGGDYFLIGCLLFVYVLATILLLGEVKKINIVATQGIETTGTITEGTLNSYCYTAEYTAQKETYQKKFCHGPLYESPPIFNLPATIINSANDQIVEIHTIPIVYASSNPHTAFAATKHSIDRHAKATSVQIPIIILFYTLSFLFIVYRTFRTDK